MSEVFKVKPTTEEIKVRDPETGAVLKAEGENKPKDTYWLRRLQEGVVEVVRVEGQALASIGDDDAQCSVTANEGEVENETAEKALEEMTKKELLEICEINKISLVKGHKTTNVDIIAAINAFATGDEAGE